MNLESSRGYGRELLKGICEYNNRAGQWEIIFEPVYYLRSGLSRNNIKAIKPDGCIIEHNEHIRDLVRMGIPIVQTISIDGTGSIPYIRGNYEEDGRMAFRHLMNLGFRNMAFFGVDFINFSKRRYESFKRHAEEHGVPVYVHHLTSNKRSFRYQNGFKRTIQWLQSLPKPIGILACNDDFGQTLINACSLAGIDVPHEVAVLGVDNDELLCNLTVPSLSSISRNLMQAASQICELLDQMMNGSKVTREFIQADPTEVIVRQSTDTIACDDAEVVKAIMFIRQNIHRHIAVDDVVSATNISRRTLYSRFKAATGHSINSEIRQRKLQRFKLLLKEKNLSVKEAAYQVGFEEIAHVSRWFASLENTSPSEWRSRHL